MKRYVPKIDELECLAHGDCEAAAPGVFRVGEIAEVVGEGGPEAILEAARACPAAAITVFEEKTGDQVYP